MPLKYLNKFIITNNVYFQSYGWTFSQSKIEYHKNSPSAILVITNLDWKNYYKLIFGKYFEVHSNPDPYNAITTSTNEATGLGPTGNLNGIYTFFCLKTGLIIKYHKCNKYPISQRVINTVKNWGEGPKK